MEWNQYIERTLTICRLQRLFMTAKIMEYHILIENVKLWNTRRNISKLKVIVLTLDAVGPYTDVHGPTASNVRTMTLCMLGMVQNNSTKMNINHRTITTLSPNILPWPQYQLCAMYVGDELEYYVCNSVFRNSRGRSACCFVILDLTAQSLKVQNHRTKRISSSKPHHNR